ncbi:MAG: glycosyltransferase [Blastochloris sp.]|nr:glycosyltransferase [Blastochloris sp.]
MKLSRNGVRPRLPLFIFQWWMPGAVLFLGAALLLVYAANHGPEGPWSTVGSRTWWIVTTLLHLPFAAILFFLIMGIVERVGFFWKGRSQETPGRLPETYPTVCVQLPMFNEHAVARRVIEAAATMDWPNDRLIIQVLDDSTDADTRQLVELISAQLRTHGIDCRVLHRTDRQGYKAGALEIGRRQTEAEFLVIFDSDFVPPSDFLVRAIPHFYHPDGTPIADLALVQAQWGHLNHDEWALTQSQSLWVDDHHTVQMAWRSAAHQFVNFTGTAGVWRASAIEAAGGWKASSLVEDCELSFRSLFAGYRTKFVKEIVAPAELPATITAYKAQQKRWTQGWVQLQRMHLGTLLLQYPASLLRRVHLLYMMSISWQWPLWTLWMLVLPMLVYTGHWYGALSPDAGLAFYLLPSLIWLVLSATIASLETRHTYAEPLTVRSFLGRVARVIPNVVISTGMLPHQFSAFCEGLFGPMNSEFERTPKGASVTVQGSASVAEVKPVAKRTCKVKIHRPYVLTEVFFCAYFAVWAALFASTDLIWCTVIVGFMISCILYLVFHYGDHDGKVLFVVDRSKLAVRLNHRTKIEVPLALHDDQLPGNAHALSRACIPSGAERLEQKR